MTTSTTTSRLSGLDLVNPQHAGGGTLSATARTVVPAVPHTRAIEPYEAGELSVEVAGAGRIFDLDEFNLLPPPM